jgi:hypothetical protein
MLMSCKFIHDFLKEQNQYSGKHWILYSGHEKKSKLITLMSSDFNSIKINPLCAHKLKVSKIFIKFALLNTSLF